MIIKSLFKTLNSMKSYNLWFLILNSILATAGLLIMLFFAIRWIFFNTSIVSIGWLDWIIDFIGAAGASMLAWFLFPLLLPLLVSLLIEKVASIIERNEYPDLSSVKSQPFLSVLWHDLKFIFWALFLNVLCLPLYLIPLVNIVVYYALNSFLLSREFFEIASRRYTDRKTASSLRKSYRFSVIGAGLIITLVTNTPFLNLISPVFAIVIMIHLFHSMYNKNKIEL